MLILNLYFVTVIFSILTIMLTFYALNHNEKFQNKMLDFALKDESEFKPSDKAEKIMDFLMAIYFMIPIFNVIASISLLSTLYDKGNK